jgi:hypothetical protein
MAEYCYKPLDNIRDCIKLFKFESIEPEPLRLTLRSFSLGSLPSYVALSHEWDNRNENQRLNVDSCMFKILVNLHQFSVSPRVRT